ncbi:Glycerol-3-phosphate acyltransferase [Neolecta irregularis DAH-3]|uniref:Glycerol-3-phosphate acyltransferase n=1 Tax=Neolecta irregularis (strain DAH-3) TaxID=1198029 RepID=A0A1U7LGQ8_NEOID|nr:Glycerol-3-phosphate acyltransferase [Neolecta irregularis DAH-3]|eukprot:OLL21829.1 Glycerol-3-phosphate acyltransferase [Neolecta irregularis DAH-3]
MSPSVPSEMLVRVVPDGELAIGDRNLTINDPQHFLDDPLNFMKEVKRYYSGDGWRSYNNYIGQPICYDGFSDRMQTKIVNSIAVTMKVKQLARERVLSDPSIHPSKREQAQKMWEARLLDVVNSVADRMIAKFNSPGFLKGACFLVNQILIRMYHQGIFINNIDLERLKQTAIHAARNKQSLILLPSHRIFINNIDLERLKQTAIHAARNKQSLILLPSHRSHIDYVTMQFIFYRLGLSLPTVVAGDNLNIPVLGSFLQHAGAFYIRRAWGDDQLYSTICQAYIDILLSRGYNFECFIEGGRSRTGKLLSPKLGILKLVVDTIINGRVKDCWIVPISMQYDKVIETESYVNELLGKPKKKESLGNLFSASSSLSLQMGRVDVRFGEPCSLQAFIKDHGSRHAKALGKQKTPKQLWLDKEFQSRLLRTLGYKVLGDINAASVVMPTSLVGTIILTLRGRGVGRKELIRRVEWLRARIILKNGRVADFGGMETGVVIDRALEVLGSLVGEGTGLLERTFYPVDRFELSLYRNQVIHLFVPECIIVASMYTKIKQGGGPLIQRISYQELFSQANFLSQLLREEFVYDTSGLKVNLDNALESLEGDDVIKIDSGFVELSTSERLGGRTNFDFYCFMIWPFIETYWLAATSLFALTPPIENLTKENGKLEDVPTMWVDTKQFHNMTQLLGKTLYHQGDLSYLEAVNIETLKNAFTRFEAEGLIIVRRTKGDKVPPMMTIHPDYQPTRNEEGQVMPTGRLWKMVEYIAISRREGKNRRDSATVSSRVLAMADLIGQNLNSEIASAKQAAMSTGSLVDVSSLDKLTKHKKLRKEKAML